MNNNLGKEQYVVRSGRSVDAQLLHQDLSSLVLGLVIQAACIVPRVFIFKLTQIPGILGVKKAYLKD